MQRDELTFLSSTINNLVYLTSIWHDSSRWSNLYWRQPIWWPNIQNYTGSKLELNVKLMLIWWAHEAHFDSSWEPILWRAHKRCQLMGPLTICTWLPGCRGPKFIALLKTWNGARRDISIEIVGPLWRRELITKAKSSFQLRVLIIISSYCRLHENRGRKKQILYEMKKKPYEIITYKRCITLAIMFEVWFVFGQVIA